MLDHIDAGANRRLDPRRAMGVGSDLQAPLMRFLGDGPQLVFGELLLISSRFFRRGGCGPTQRAREAGKPDPQAFVYQVRANSEPLNPGWGARHGSYSL